MLKNRITAKIASGRHLEIKFQEEDFYFTITKTCTDTNDGYGKGETFNVNKKGGLRSYVF